MEISILVFIFGIMVGSFLNVCIYRLPAEKSVVTPRSHCPHCDKLIAGYDNIPLISYILLGGKCRYCKTPIPFRYFFVELLTGLCFLLIHVMFKGPNFASISYIFVTACLIAITFIDFDHFIIPDVITYPGMVIGLLCSVVLVYFPQRYPPLISEYSIVSAWSGKYMPIVNSIMGLLVGGGILYIIAVIAKAIVKKDAMGGGDIKLLAFVGTFIGWKLILITLIFASFIGSIVGGIQLAYMRLKNKETNLTGHYIPFGPYLAIGTLFAILWGNPLIHWYLYKILMLDMPPGGRMP
jgi:leader peptidase (prepilin peptidase) / N-methyltransferase